MQFVINIKDINKLSVTDVTAIYTRFSWPNSESSSSIRVELDKRYVHPKPGPHPEMAIALIWFNDQMAGWVGTRAWPEKFKGDSVMAQTIECFVAPEHRRRGFGRLGLQALIAAGFIDRNKPVSVYAPEVVKMAKKCGCNIVLLCNS